MAIFTWPFPSNPSAPPLLGVMALAVAAIAAILLAAGLLNLYGNPQAPTVQAQNIAADRAALVALYNATNGDNWTNNTNWNSDAPLGQWHGVQTNASGRVNHLSLGNNNLTGMLPAEISNLSNLMSLTLYTNNLTGPIPAELDDLSNLVDLTLYGNGLTGSIPPELGQLRRLRSMLIYNNSLTGTVPAELGDLTPGQVISLDFSGNQLTGQLPLQLTRLTQVNFLRFHDNAGLCAPLDSAFQTWLQGVTSNLQGDNCPATRIHSGHNPPLVNQPVTALLTTREHRLARIQATQDAYETDPCIGYDDSGDRAGLSVPVWTWERADADSNDPNAPDDSTWASVTDGRHPNATFVYLPQSGDVGKFLRATLTHGSPEQTDTTDAIGPVTDQYQLPDQDIVNLPAAAGELRVGSALNANPPAAISAKRWDPAVNPRPEVWQWEAAPSGGAAWVNVTPYHLHCEQPDTEYTLTAAENGNFISSYLYYNDDSSGSVVRKNAVTAVDGTVAP